MTDTSINGVRPSLVPQKLLWRFVFSFLALAVNSANANEFCPPILPADVQPVSLTVPYKSPGDYFSYPGGGPYYYADGYEFAERALEDALATYEPPFHYYGGPILPTQAALRLQLARGSLSTALLSAEREPVRQDYLRDKNTDGVPVDVKCPVNYDLRSEGGVHFCVPVTPCEGDPQKQPRDCPTVGNPVNTATGNKFQREADYVGAGNFPLKITRYYSSDPFQRSNRLGYQWRHSYDRSVFVIETNDINTAIVFHGDGRGTYFYKDSNDDWIGDSDTVGHLERLYDELDVPTGWRYRADNVVEDYNVRGRLISITKRSGLTQTLDYDSSGRVVTVTDPAGRTLSYTYDDKGHLATVTDPAGAVYTYSYDGNNNLAGVAYPDETPSDDTDNPQRIYHYEDTRFPNALTGITDENGNRFATWAYDDQGRAIFSEHAGNAERVELVYNNDGTTSVTDAQGRIQTYHFDVLHGVYKTSQIHGGPCKSCGGQAQSTTYDANGNIASRTDFNGHVTNYTYDLDRNLETRRTEAVGTAAERTTSTVWHADLRLPVQIDVFDDTGRHRKRTSHSYDGVGRLLTRTETDMASGASRTTNNTYNELGLIASRSGARTDVSDITTYGYDTQGNLITTINALGQMTQVTQHDAHGRPLTLRDPNGLVTQLTYDTRGRLTSRTVDGQVTVFSYDGVGNLTGVTLPNGVSLSYTYDAAQRQTGITDNAGNTIAYTLDAMGNRVKEDVTDPTGVLTRTQSRVYNTLSRLVQTVGGAGQQTDYGYDANGNRISATDGRGNQTTSAFDALNRLVATTDALNGVTSYEYDALDNLTKVIDPKGLATRYTYNALGDLLQLQSPDTGTTRYTYDAAGNRLSQTDAKGIQIFYAYDALNRLTVIDYADDTLDVTFTFDEGTNGIGRLTTMNDAGGSTDYWYDLRGNLIAVETTRDGQTHTTGYAYNGAGQVIRMTYPSGRIVDYPRNALGQISSVSTILDGDTRTLASGIAYAPFGPLTGLTFGNGVPLTRTLDLDYRLTAQLHENVLDQGFNLDLGNNITAITDNLDTTRDRRFAYDGLDRVIQANGSTGDLDYTYDAVGNRLARTLDGATDDYTYDSNSHRLQGTTRDIFDYDANGNAIQKDLYTFNYGQHNRLSKVLVGGATIAAYTHNGRGERVKKDTGELTYFHYDTAGQLIAETDANGETLREYVYLDGMPIATVARSSTSATTLAIEPSVNHTWQTVTFPNQGATPVIIAGPSTYHGSSPGVIRLRNVTANSAQVAFKEWNYLNGDHTTEQVSLLALTPGRYSLSDGSIWEIGRFSLNGTLKWTSIGFNASFTQAPRVFLTAQTANGVDPVTVRAREVTTSGFQAALFEQDSKNSSGHTAETVGYLAIVSPTGGDSVTLEGKPVDYTVTSTVVYGNFKGVAGHSIKLQEEQSQDAETGHTGETVAVLTVDGHVFAQDTTSIGRDTVAIRRNSATQASSPTTTTGTYYIHADHLNTPQIITDDARDTVWQAEYTPFGEASITAQAIEFNLRFPGQYYDAETGLHYNYFRDYDPGTGRYIQSDPVGLLAGMNTYLYVDANPITGFDVLGLMKCDLKWFKDYTYYASTGKTRSRLKRGKWVLDCRIKKQPQVDGELPDMKRRGRNFPLGFGQDIECVWVDRREWEKETLWEPWERGYLQCVDGCGKPFGEKTWGDRRANGRNIWSVDKPIGTEHSNR